MNCIRRRVLKSAVGASIMIGVAGCTGREEEPPTPVGFWGAGEGPAVEITASPVTDREIAEMLSRTMTAEEAIIADTVLDGQPITRYAEGPEVRLDVPFVRSNHVFSFDAEPVGDAVGFRVIVSLSPPSVATADIESVPPDSRITVDELPTPDHEQLIAAPGWSIGELTEEVRTSAIYLDVDLDDSVIAPAPVVTHIGDAEGWVTVTVTSIEQVELTEYRYSLTERPYSASDLGRTLRESYSFELPPLDAPALELLSEVIDTDGGYQRDSSEPSAELDSLLLAVTDGDVLPLYFDVEDVRLDGPSGSYLINFQNETYHLQLELNEGPDGYSFPEG